MAKVEGNPYQCQVKDGDIGYIDGYVSGGDGRPCAVFVRLTDGVVDLVYNHSLKAIYDLKAIK